jgi:hypothetical protein
MASLMVRPSASPARYFPRRLGGQCTNLSWYLRGQRADKVTVLTQVTNGDTIQYHLTGEYRGQRRCQATSPMVPDTAAADQV